MYFVLSLLFFSFKTLAAIEITSLTTPEEFPIQVADPLDQTAFFRNGSKDAEKIYCPSGYIFDSDELICVKIKEETDEAFCHLMNFLEGDWPNPDNCRRYCSCSAGYCYNMPCSYNLLFNSDSKRCEYPLEARCCEHQEKNSNRLVQ